MNVSTSSCPHEESYFGRNINTPNAFPWEKNEGFQEPCNKTPNILLLVGTHPVFPTPSNFSGIGKAKKGL